MWILHNTFGHSRLFLSLIFAAAFLQAPLAEAASNVRLGWDASPSPKVVGYTVYYGPESSVYTSSMPVGNTLVATISNLTEQTTYFFTVRAITSTGLESDPSNEVSYFVPKSAPNGPDDGNQTVVDTSYLTGQKLGELRNDFSGYLGMKIEVGADPLIVTTLGRMMATGNTGTHRVKFVRASDGLDVPGGEVSISMNGGTVGQFQYGHLTTPVVLSAGTAYYLVSLETNGGDAWFNWDSAITTTDVASNPAVVWAGPSGNWFPQQAPGRCFVLLDFKYLASPPPPETVAIGYVSSQKLGSLRNDFNGYLGMKIEVGADPLIVTALGRMMATGNIGTHSVKFVTASDGVDVPGGRVSLAMSGGTVGQFQYAQLTTPLVLSAATDYYLVSQETNGGDAWFNWDTAITTTDVASNISVVWERSPGVWFPYQTPGRCFVLLDFKYLAHTTVP